MSRTVMGKRTAPLTELPAEFTQAHRFGKNFVRLNPQLCLRIMLSSSLICWPPRVRHVLQILPTAWAFPMPPSLRPSPA